MSIKKWNWNCAAFTNCVSKIYNTQIDANDTDVLMLMYNLIEYSDIYSKTLRRLWQYYRDEQALGGTNSIINFPADNDNSISFEI